MSAKLTFEKDDSAGFVIVEVKGPEYGSDETISRRQAIGETLGDMIYVYELAREKREMTILFVDLDEEERGKLEFFFSANNADLAKRWFRVELPPVKKLPIRAGATLSGAPVKAGKVRAGEFISQDLVRYVVRLKVPEIVFVDTPKDDGLFSCSLSLRVLTGFLPENFC